MKRNATKDRIFRTAVDMFSSVGYSESTMRELASRVGIRAASLYYYYPSKNVLLDEAIEYFVVNDAKYRTDPDDIVHAARGRSVQEIMAMLYIRYVASESFYLMAKILKIIICSQYDCARAREAFNDMYYCKALSFRQLVLERLVAQKVLLPCDCRTVAYLMTSYSMMRFMECMNRRLPIEEYADFYNEGIDDFIALLAKTVELADG